MWNDKAFWLLTRQFTQKLQICYYLPSCCSKSVWLDFFCRKNYSRMLFSMQWTWKRIKKHCKSIITLSICNIYLSFEVFQYLYVRNRLKFELLLTEILFKITCFTFHERQKVILFSWKTWRWVNVDRFFICEWTKRNNWDQMTHDMLR